MRGDTEWADLVCNCLFFLAQKPGNFIGFSFVPQFDSRKTTGGRQGEMEVSFLGVSQTIQGGRTQCWVFKLKRQHSECMNDLLSRSVLDPARGRSRGLRDLQYFAGSIASFRHCAPKSCEEQSILAG